MQCIFAAAKGLPAAVRSLRWGVGEFGLEEVEVAGDLGVLGAAAAVMQYRRMLWPGMGTHSSW